MSPSARKSTKKSASAAPSAPRVRRSAREARERILDAAEARLRQGGPEAIRLQEIAADVGISHPTILHHFESRDGLTRALSLRITQRLVDDLAKILTDEPVEEASAEEIVDHLFTTLHQTGTARLLAWRALSEAPATDAQELLQDLTTLLHKRRVDTARARGAPTPTREDSTFIARLVSAAALGDALNGEVWRRPGESDADGRFRHWFARLLLQHLAQ